MGFLVRSHLKNWAKEVFGQIFSRYVISLKSMIIGLAINGVEIVNFDWISDDELKVHKFSLSFLSSLTPPNVEAGVVLVGRS